MIKILFLCWAMVLGEDKPVSYYIEAEDGEGLLRYPYHNEDARGWYASEADCRFYGAPGKTYCAAIHESSAPESRTLSIPLQTPLPPGKWRVFLRTVGPRTAFEETIIIVSLGATSVEFRWRQGRWFSWQAGREIELTEAVESIRLTAAQFGGVGHGGMYEPLERSIWVDTVYLTNDLFEKVPPDIQTELAQRAGFSPDILKARPAYAADDSGPANYGTPAPARPISGDVILLRSFDGRKNLWPNSSIELGMNDGWAAQGGGYVFTDEDLDPQAPFHGRYSLRVPKGGAFSRPYYLPSPGKAALSAYLRGNTGKVTLSLIRVPDDFELDRLVSGPNLAIRTVLLAEGAVGTQWQRLSSAGELQAGWYYLSIQAVESVSLDGIQLEWGTEPTPYAPRAGLEGAVRTGQLGNILYEDQNTLIAWFHNSDDSRSVKAQLNYRILDVRDEVVAEGKTRLVKVGPGETVMKEMGILPALRGMFTLFYTVGERLMPEGETVYLRMPHPPRGATRHQLGGNMALSPTELPVHARFGLQWVLTCKSRELGAASEGVHPKPDEWNWYDDRAALPAQLGMAGVIPCLWPGRIPDFMAEGISGRYRATRGALRGSRPKIDIWRDYVTRVARQYKDTVHSWCIDDEAELSWDPAVYAEVVEATADAVHAAAPGVKVALSATPEFTEELLHYVPVGKIDLFGGSTFDFSYWEAHKVRSMKKRFNKPWICYGVGNRVPSRTMYHTSYAYEPVYWNAARMARRTISMVLEQDLDVAGHYAALVRNDGVHVGFNKPLCDYDGTPLPWGGTFGCLGTLLADAVPIDDVPLGATGRRALLFRLRDQIGAVTWSTFVPDYDHNWRPAQREIKGLTLNATQGAIQVLDMYWNKRSGIQWFNSGLKLNLTEEPVFLFDEKLGEEGLRACLQSATAPPELLEIATRLVADGAGSLALEVGLQNYSDTGLRNLLVDLRPHLTAKGLSIAGEWLLKKPVATLSHLPAGQTRNVTLPCMLDGRHPYENGQVRVNVHADGGVEAAADDHVWLLPAPVVKDAPVLNGHLDEWDGRSAAWLFYNWAWAPFTRNLIQLHEGGEHFSYPPYRVDARASFWTAWDNESLYIAARLEDDQPVLALGKDEMVRLVIGTDGNNLREVLLRPRGDGKLHSGTEDSSIRVCSVRNERNGRNGARAEVQKVSSVEFEAAVPWKFVGVRPEPGSVILFDLFWTDMDREGDEVVSGTLRWAGGARKSGYLWLR